MKSSWVVGLLLLAVLVAVGVAFYANRDTGPYSVTVEELMANPEKYEDQTVIVEGTVLAFREDLSGGMVLPNIYEGMPNPNANFSMKVYTFGNNQATFNLVVHKGSYIPLPSTGAIPEGNIVVTGKWQKSKSGHSLVVLGNNPNAIVPAE